MIMDIWPFRFYRVDKTKSLCISLICCDDQAWGWEWGYREVMRGEDCPIIEFRIGKLMLLYIEFWKREHNHEIGFELRFMGFWSVQ